MSFRVLNDLGVGTDSAVITAIDRAIELKSKYNIRVINLSLGRAVYESYTLDPLCQAVERAWKAGIGVVAAAGNYGRYSPTSGYATIGSPGIDPFVITVGAMKSMSTMGRGDDQITSFSSKGPTLIDHVIKPDLVATGNRDINAALENTDLVTAPVTMPLSPRAAYDASTGQVTMVGGSSLVWVDKTASGFSLVWGNSLVWGALIPTNYSLGVGDK